VTNPWIDPEGTVWAHDGDGWVVQADVAVGAWNVLVQASSWTLLRPLTSNPDLHVVTSAVTVIMPSDGVVGDVHTFMERGSGVLTFDLVTNAVTVEVPLDKALGSRAVLSTFSVVCVAPLEWVAYGDLGDA